MDSSVFSKDLTTREFEVLYLLAEGYKTREISEKLHISVSTVTSHKNNLMKKLGARNSTHLIFIAFCNNLL
jgi:DNA-binding NarL/FixJ family response regulator